MYGPYALHTKSGKPFDYLMDTNCFVSSSTHIKWTELSAKYEEFVILSYLYMRVNISLQWDGFCKY